MTHCLDHICGRDITLVGMDLYTTDIADQALLDATPAFLSISELFKAKPATEGGKRFVYMEPDDDDEWERQSHCVRVSITSM